MKKARTSWKRTTLAAALMVAPLLVALLGPVGAAPIPPPRPDSGWLLDEGSGTALAQWNGFRTGQLLGTPQPTWSSDVPIAYAGNTSLAFVHTVPAGNAGNYARLGGAGAGTQGTVAFWVRDENGANPAYILDSNSGRTLMYRTAPAPAGAFGTYVNGTSIGGINGTLVPGPGSGSPWTHVAIVWDNTEPTQKQKIYKNGALFDTKNVTLGTTNPSNIYLGSRQSTNETWGGKLDEYALWNRPLTGDEVAWLAGNSISAIPNTQVGNPSVAWLFNEGTGSAALPYFGSGNGTLQSNVGWTTNPPGRHGSASALDYDGTSTNRVNFPGRTFGTQGSIHVWAYADWDVTQGGWKYLMDATSGARTLLAHNGNADGWQLHLNNQFVGTMTGLIPEGEWTEIVITWDNSLAYGKQKVYKNGDLFAVFNLTLATSVSALLTFGSNNGNSEPWIGALDDFAIWDRALSPGEVDWLFENSIATLPEPGTMSLLAMGGIAALIRRRRRSK